MQQRLSHTGSLEKIGIIAGSGDLPEKLINGCIELGRDIFVISLDCNDKHPVSISKVPNMILNIGSVGKAINALHSQGISEIVFAGKVERPKLAKLRPDLAGVKLLAKLTNAKLHGDNSLLTTVIKFFEESGFKIVGVDDVIRELLIPVGKIGKYEPDNLAKEDIELGIKVARTIGELDIGQSVVVQKGVVIGVEAIEGTDALLKRCQEFRLEGEGGVLIKMKKPIQDTRIDLPTIGVTTVNNAHKAGLKGIAVEARGALIIDREKVAETANKLGMFVIGV